MITWAPDHGPDVAADRRVAAIVVPRAGVDLDRGKVRRLGGHGGEGIAHAAFCAADARGGPSDLIVFAVSAGTARAFLAKLGGIQ